VKRPRKTHFAKPILITMGVAALVAIGLAVTAHVAPDLSTGIFKGLGPSLAFGLQTVVFVVITGGEIIVARNHKDPLGPAVGASALLLPVAHLMLQGGGFYDQLLRDTPSHRLKTGGASSP
jgi:hypothetical protein